MAKRKESSNYDAVGGIFDFIFQEADKPVDKRRPVRPSGFSAQGALTDQIFAVLEKPGAFVSNTLIDEFNNALDVNIASANFNEYGSIKLSTNNLAKFLKDPSGEVKKISDRAKAQRKASRVRMLGEAMDDFLTTAWAHKYGDLEARRISLASATANEKAESYKIARAVGQSGRPEAKKIDQANDFMIDRTVELMGKKTFGTSWHGLSEDEKVKFANFLNKKPTKIDIQAFLARNYGSPVALSFATVSLPFDDSERIDISEPEIYKTLENEHVTDEINALTGFAPSSPEGKQRKIYEKTKLLINLRTKKQIGDLTKKLTDPSLTPTQRARINQAILDGETSLRLVGGRALLVSSIGRWEGYINSINTVWGGVMGAQSLVPSILDGKFFDSGKNPLGPTTESNKLGVKGLEGMKVVVAKKGNNKVINTYNQMGEALYYLTPRSVFRTLFVNGEGFARQLIRNNMGLLEAQTSMGDFGAEGIIDTINKRVGTDLKNELNTALAGIRAGGTFNADDLEKIKKLLNRSKNMRNLTHIFSFPERFKGVISNRFSAIIGPQMVKVRTSIVKAFLKNKNIAKWIGKTGGGKFLREFIQKGGLKNLLKPIFTAIAGTLGVALTPVVGFLISIATGVVMDLAMKGASVLFQIGKIILIAIVAAVVLGLGGAKKTWKKFNKKSFSYNYVVPTTVKQCEIYEEMYAGGITEPGTPLNPGFGTPCAGGGGLKTEDIFEQAKVYVSENYGNVEYASLAIVEQCYETLCPSLWCISSTPIVCLTVVTSQSCEVQYNLFVHELLHQVQYSGDCGGSVMMEWGADYLSNNGGWYTFGINGGGCTIEATDTPIPSECSSIEDVMNVALCRASSGDACRSALRNLVTSKCP